MILFFLKKFCLAVTQKTATRWEQYQNDLRLDEENLESLKQRSPTHGEAGPLLIPRDSPATTEQPKAAPGSLMVDHSASNHLFTVFR